MIYSLKNFGKIFANSFNSKKIKKIRATGWIQLKIISKSLSSNKLTPNLLVLSFNLIKFLERWKVFLLLFQKSKILNILILY